MSETRRRRVYKNVTVEQADGGYHVALDGKPLHTPKRRVLTLPTAALAQAIAAEWRAQGDVLDPLAMPLTRLADSAHDQVGPNRAAVAARTADYAGTDLLCYRAALPAELAARQQAHWQPLLDWAVLRYEAPLLVTSGVVAIEQPAAALAALARAVEAHDDMRLTALAAATAACGSLLLALALAEGRIDAETAWALSLLDETFQIERWGEDGEATQRRAGLKADIAATARFLALLQG